MFFSPALIFGNMGLTRNQILIAVLVAVVVLVIAIIVYYLYKKENFAPRVALEYTNDADFGMGSHSLDTRTAADAYGHKALANGKLRASPEDIYEEDRARYLNSDAATATLAGTQQQPGANTSNWSDLKFDYNQVMQDLVVDNRMRENQKKWYSEFQPWGGSNLRNVDTIEHENYMPRVGIRAFSIKAVAQGNPTTIQSDVDEKDLARFSRIRY